jgi:hypothetical protein
MSARPSASERLCNPDALLTRGDLAALGLERRAIDAVLRALPVVALPGYSRPLIRVGDYMHLITESTHNGKAVSVKSSIAATFTITPPGHHTNKTPTPHPDGYAETTQPWGSAHGSCVQAFPASWDQDGTMRRRMEPVPSNDDADLYTRARWG